MNRRDFTGKSILALAGVCGAGLAGYAVFNQEKIRIFNNVHRMGHCAPSVMRTLLEINDINDCSLILYSGCMAGGIAGQGTECGILTAPLMFLGVQQGQFDDISANLGLIARAQSYFLKFEKCNNTTLCSVIRNKGTHACRKTIYDFYNLYKDAISSPVIFSEATAESYSLLLKTFGENKFHCAHNVLNNPYLKITVDRNMLNSTWLFNGGIAMLNHTCGALAAGVILLSSATATIEDSYSRVAKMNRLLKQKSNKAMDDDINSFNKAINLSDELGGWFRSEFGSTSCSDIRGYDFSNISHSETYIKSGCMMHCRFIANKVAGKVSEMI